MKRILACLLILLLPFQSVWAHAGMVGVLCGDAVPAAAMHDEGLTHHEHHAADHAAKHTVGGTADEAAQGGCNMPDGHCASCHAGGCAASMNPWQPVAAVGDAPCASVPGRLPSAFSERPERPKWSILA